jgi:nucleotide-binding universal stress UspA family protein
MNNDRIGENAKRLAQAAEAEAEVDVVAAEPEWERLIEAAEFFEESPVDDEVCRRTPRGIADTIGLGLRG